jgi:hypothetical protein
VLTWFKGFGSVQEMKTTQIILSLIDDEHCDIMGCSHYTRKEVGTNTFMAVCSLFDKALKYDKRNMIKACKSCIKASQR